MNALERSKRLYDEYLEYSGDVLPDKFRESDPFVEKVSDNHQDSEWAIFPDGIAKILNVYRRWESIEAIHGMASDNAMKLYKRFGDMCFRQKMKARAHNAEERYIRLEQMGVTPESVITAFVESDTIEAMHADVISAYAIPFFTQDAAFVDLITNEASPYREGEAFHSIVAKEIDKDRARRAEKAKERLAD